MQAPSIIRLLKIVIAASFWLGAVLCSAEEINSACGVDLREAGPMEAFGDQRLDSIARDRKKPTVCREGNRYFMILPPPGRTTIYITNPIVPWEIFTGKPIAHASRVAYVQKMHLRANRVVEAALDSGLIRDARVLDYLRALRREIFQVRNPVAMHGPIDTPYCLKRGSIAYVEPYSQPLTVYLCREGFDSESPHTLIHEYVHVIQLSRKLRNIDLAGECEADLVAMMATAVAAKLGVIKREWDITGSYMGPLKCPADRQRMIKFSESLDKI